MGPGGHVLETTVDCDRLAGHIASVVSGQKRHHGGNLLGSTPTAKGDMALKTVGKAGNLAPGLPHLGDDETRGNGIDPHADVAVAARLTAGQRVNGGL